MKQASIPLARPILRDPEQHGTSRLLLVDADLDEAHDLTIRLVNSGRDLTNCESLEDVARIAQWFDPDLVLVAPSALRGDIEGAIADVRLRTAAPIAIGSHGASIGEQTRALEAGASVVVWWPPRWTDLTWLIPAAAALDRQPPPLIVGPLRLDTESRVLLKDGSPVRLSQREFELLAFMMRNAGRCLSHKELMANVWDTREAGDLGTLRKHVRRLRRLLDDDRANPPLIVTVFGKGYCLVPP